MMNSRPMRDGKHNLGIMTTESEGHPPFLNRAFYQRLCLLGGRLGLTVYVFSPAGIDWSKQLVKGYSYNEKAHGWTSRWRPLPDLVYDRCFFSKRKQYIDYRQALRKLQERKTRFLGVGLKGKWEVDRILRRDDRFADHLPETEELRSMRTLTEWLKLRGEAVLKPQGGSQGRGVLHVRQVSGRDLPANAARKGNGIELSSPIYVVRGRDARNRAISHTFSGKAALLRWIRLVVSRRRYLIQQYLMLQSKNGSAYDIRALVQKNGRGDWQLTGMAVRQGRSDSLTSNIHGGGTVQSAAEFLSRQFDADRSDYIQKELARLSELIPESLEQSHGRLVELGIDFGVDASGRIWILEVNSRPGRSIFAYLKDEQARLAAFQNPLQYAKYLLQGPNRRSSSTVK